MAYGDITGSPDRYRAPGKPGVQTVRRAVVLKDASTIGSAAINYLDNTKDLNALTTVAHTENGAGVYIGTAGNICVNLSTLSLVDAANSASDIMASGEKYEIHRPILFQNIAAGSFLPIEVDRIFAFATTADDIMAIY